MFCAEDDDSPKTPIVHPNDVLDIEVSPVAQPFLLLPPTSSEQGAQRTDNTTGVFAHLTTKQKLKKSSKHSSINCTTRKITAASMKRGDPFLPSVFSDENPIADFTVKKNSRKKPSDCKCKGFGYNLSPSALLPEEMRQQWGVGVFGKHIAVRPSSSANSGGLHNSYLASISCANDIEASRCSANRLPSACYSETLSSGNTNNSNNTNNISKESGEFCAYRCMRCMQDSCICAEMGQVRDGFRIPDYNEKRKQKIASKGMCYKGKDPKASPCGAVNNALSSTPMKRSACFNSKEHSNIISTSNFPRNSPSPVHMPYPSYMYSSDPIGMAPSPSLMKSVSASKICLSATEPHMLSKSNGFVNGEYLNLPRPSPVPSVPRRVVANISAAPIISTGSLDANAQNNFQTPKKPMLPRGVTPTRRIISQDCDCDSCRRRSNLMSTMEALGLSTSNSNQTVPPLLLTRHQRFNHSRIQSFPIPSRYSPYRIPSFSYKSTLRDVYGSPESYGRSSSPFYDYGESTGLGPPVLASTPLPMSQDLSVLDTSSLYLDNVGSSMSPASMHSGSWMVDDITDLSIQETVEFFVNMKPPIITSVPSPQSDTSSDMFPPSPGEPRCSSPCLTSGSGSCFCSGHRGISNWGTQQAIDRPYGRDGLMSFNDPSHGRFSSGENGHSPYPPSSMLYSSLVSDLEDELRCAIENIPSA